MHLQAQVNLPPRSPIVDDLKLLVVDDEPGMRLGVQRALKNFEIPVPESTESAGICVELAETGEEAIDKIHREKPDILLLDYKLPGLSGLQILEKFQIEESEMVIIMMTAYASLETAVTAIKQGAFDFLPKPFTPDELKKLLVKAVQNLLLARQVKRLAQEKQQVRFEFIRVLGHELKSPLNAVEGYLNLMHSRSAGEQIAEYDHMIDRSLIRLDGMRKLIADLLDLTRIESGRKKREFKICRIENLARQAIETFQTDSENQNITLLMHCDPDLEYYGDPGEIEIILNNLISNAIKYNKPSGSVEISLSRTSDALKISVKDSGIGMSAEESERLFQEFSRIKNNKTRNILGSGLGLTIVQKTAQLYHGEVTVESQPDAGSCFTVLLRENV